MDTHIQTLRQTIEQELTRMDMGTDPQHLYEPIRYFVGLGGKRIRPILTLMGCELMGGKAEDAMNQALAVEVFHNFTLVHDDIMDRADVRRGLPTVHVKWNDSIGILSGDAMFVIAYQYLAKAHADKLPKLLSTFSDTALLVCEGQQKDMDYAHRSDVTYEDYIEMIRCKTAVLLGGAMQLGAIVAGATEKDLEGIKSFAEFMGLAFQIRDDYLDAFGTTEDFGKKIGGDIEEGKRTWLTIMAFERANSGQRTLLEEAFKDEDMSSRVKKVIAIYRELNIDAEALAEIQRYSVLSSQALENVEGEEGVKDQLRSLVDYLIGRSA